MSALSNIFRRHDRGGGGPITCRPLQEGELHQALRMILATDRRLAPEDQVVDFMRFALQRRINLNAGWGAEQEGKLRYALLPVTSPGRSMLFFAAPCPTGEIGQLAASALIEETSLHYGRRGVDLAQVLLMPEDAATQQLFAQNGFSTMAELVYLQASPRKQTAFPLLGDGLHWETYSPLNHEKFARTILGSYRDSLDCPALNGMRSIQDVVDGHKATGAHDPSLWFLLCDGEWPRAVLLLSPTPTGEALELVYLGLIPEARGRGLGDIAMRQALAVTAADGYEHLSLAVDSQNAPAMRLYFRHGMRRVCNRMAMIRDLRSNRVPEPVQ